MTPEEIVKAQEVEELKKALESAEKVLIAVKRFFEEEALDFGETFDLVRSALATIRALKGE